MEVLSDVVVFDDFLSFPLAPVFFLFAELVFGLGVGLQEWIELDLLEFDFLVGDDVVRGVPLRLGPSLGFVLPEFFAPFLGISFVDKHLI